MSRSCSRRVIHPTAQVQFSRFQPSIVVAWPGIDVDQSVFLPPDFLTNVRHKLPQN